MTLLPLDVQMYLLEAAGTASLVNAVETVDLAKANDFLRFIDDGQRVRYLIGSADTSPQRPSNATYKLGVVQPHSSFTPHAHGEEHFVLSLGYAACTLYDPDRHQVVTVSLPPATMIRIPAMLPHSFGNRAGQPLLILAANTGLGIDHEDYAITAAEAERRDLVVLAKALRELEDAPLATLTWRERLAAWFRAVATALERREGDR
jgi:hypothetical protein